MPDKKIGHEVDQLSINIDDLLEKVPAILCLPTIPKVPEHLRSVNVKAYEPEMIAIGPFTYDLRSKNHLKGMEEHKKRFLKELLKRKREEKGEESAESYVMAMRKLEKSARSCYSEPVSLFSDQFAVMMLLDACFIVELLRYRSLKKWQDNTDPILLVNWILMKLGRDLLLADNQLPFFVLREFYDLTKTPDEEADKNFHGMISHFFKDLAASEPSRDVQIDENEIEHLLGFIHKCFSGSPKRNKEAQKWKFIRCATELQEAGIEFQKMEENETANFFDIKFEKGIMKIPELTIDDDTESLLRNLIVYEQHQIAKCRPFTNYVNLMDCLINTAKDVKILCKRGILINLLGDDEVVAKLFSTLGDSVELPKVNRYEDKFNRVNDYCNRRCNRWMANLWHNYFNTPWAIISFFAALLLLILTVAQTVISILAYLG